MFVLKTCKLFSYLYTFTVCVKILGADINLYLILDIYFLLQVQNLFCDYIA